ncbi:MAG: hypothetical protein IKN78_10865, partial [Bacteroidales bacterium]|nr:hypothetical protein [Bacteroidales bacterium]
WMRYFTEMTADTRTPAPELLADPDIAKAVKLLEVINYNKAEEYLYDRYWDGVSVEATWKGIGRDEGLQKGLQQGREEGLQQGLLQGREEGMQKGRSEERRKLARDMLDKGIPPSIVEEITGLTEEKTLSMGETLPLGGENITPSDPRT